MKGPESVAEAIDRCDEAGVRHITSQMLVLTAHCDLSTWRQGSRGLATLTVDLRCVAVALGAIIRSLRLHVRALNKIAAPLRVPYICRTPCLTRQLLEAEP